MSESTLSRRDFLLNSSLAVGGVLAGGVLPGCSSTRSKKENRDERRVVIIGAGLAGLVAGYELKKRGIMVEILEARNRVGGRTWTIRDGFAEGQHAEAGAEFVDTTHTTLLRYVKQFHLQLTDRRSYRSEGQYLVAVNGKHPEPFDRYFASAERAYEQFSGEVKRFAKQYRQGRFSDAELDRQSIADFYNRAGARGKLRFYLDYLMRVENFAQAKDISLLAAVDMLQELLEVDSESETSGVEAFTFTHGTDQLAKAFAKTLDQRVVLQAVVQAVTLEDNQRFAVHHSLGTSPADIVIVTCPGKPLQLIDFQPLLPIAVRKAINAIPYGKGLKTLLQYRKRFWRLAGSNGDLITDRIIDATYETAIHQRGAAGILAGYTTTKRAEKYDALPSDKARVQRSVDDLEAIFPGSKSDLLHGVAAAWDLDPYAGGPYSFPGIGYITKHVSQLQRPAGNVIFAGEHTEVEYQGYMEGALRSGLRAVQQTAQLLEA